MHRKITYLILATLTLFAGTTWAAKPTKKDSKKTVKKPGKSANRVIYVVGNIPITSLDLQEMKANIRFYKKSGRKNLKAEEFLIEKAIVQLEAQRESLFVSDIRIKNEIKRIMDSQGISNEKALKKFIKKQFGMPYHLWIADRKYQILRAQLMQIKVQSPPPTEKEMKSFYRKNKNRVGKEVAWREIVFAFRNISQERSVSAEAKKIHARVSANPRVFGQLAGSHPKNISSRRRKGGYYSFTPLQEIAQRSLPLASLLSRLSPGQVGPIFRGDNNRYYIIKLESRRNTPYEKIKPIIRQQMQYVKADDAFAKWMKDKKKEIAIIKFK